MAHEEELRRALVPLAEAFGRWARGEVGSGELTERIHEFHQGPARSLYLRYNGGYLEMQVAHAVVTGILDRSRIPGELLEHLAGALSFYEADRASSGGASA